MNIDKRYYRKYEKIIFVSKQNKKSFEKTYGQISKYEVIKNYIDKTRILEMAKENDTIEDIDFLTIARLVQQKAIDRLIRVHKRLIDEGIKHKIYVIGDGPLKNELQKQINRLKVNETFILMGEKKNPYPYLKKSKIFVLLSYFEGYGMVIEEAKIFEKPIIITNTAAKEAIKGYEKGIIVENAENEIYVKLKSILCKKRY